jgi:2-(1,2-epoxy-1,2-dihydrophenyl)acetyl-CoA isomerase
MSFVLKTVEDGVMKIVLNRPDAMNALNRDMMSGLNDALEEAAGNRDIGCVVVRGAGDMRFVGKSARMTTAFAKVGFSGDFGSHYFLHKLVGTSKARELYFTAEILNAEQIEKLCLANRVVDDANLESETMTFARKLAAGPRVAWWHVKKNMKVAEEGTLSEALDSEAARMIRTGETEDHKEAARAFVEKRAPVFRGH